MGAGPLVLTTRRAPGRTTRQPNLVFIPLDDMRYADWITLLRQRPAPFRRRTLIRLWWVLCYRAAVAMAAGNASALDRRAPASPTDKP